MSISQISSPLKIAPVYNPNWFIVNSTNVAQEDFTYVFDVYTSTATTFGTRLIRVRVPPEPVTLYGVYNPQKILQTQIENEFKPLLTGCTAQDTIEYSVRIGEAYVFYWPFTGSFTGTSTASTFSTIVGLSGVTSHFFTVGDRILLAQTTITVPAYEGVWEVIGVPSSTQILLNLQATTGTSISGTARVFNSVPTIFPNLFTYSGYVGNNAAIETVDFLTYRGANYVENTYFPNISGTSQFYTNAWESYKLRDNNRVVLPWVYPNVVSSVYPIPNRVYVNVTDDNGNVSDYNITISCADKINEIGAGPWNLNNTNPSSITILNGTLPIIKPNSVSYYVTLRNTSFSGIVVSYAEINSGITTNQVVVAGTHNTRPYYTWSNGGNNYVLWWSSANVQWEVTSTLGGGNQYLVSVNTGTTTCPPLGVYNTEWLDGANPQFTAFTTSYCGLINLVQPFNFEIYDYCGKYNNYEFIFMDRKGSWFPINFELTQRQNVNKQQASFKRGLGTYNGSNNYTYNSYDRGLTNYKNDINYIYVITSNWFNEEQSLYYEELFTSPEIYWNRDGNGTFVAINITQTSEEVKTKKNTRLIQYTIQFELANNPVVQVGS